MGIVAASGFPTQNTPTAVADHPLALATAWGHVTEIEDVSPARRGPNLVPPSTFLR